MLFPFFFAAGAALVFYVLLPVIGGFRVRARWRRFRERFLALRDLPPLGYPVVAAGLSPGATPPPGGFTLRGVVEAFEGEQLLWVRGAEVSAAIDLERTPLHVLLPEDAGRGGLPAGTVESQSWSSVRMLSEGTRILVGGRISFATGRPVFVEEAELPLVALAYDCPEEELFRRVIAGARHRNEYWNPWTRISLIAGIAAGSLILLLGPGLSPFPTVRILAFIAAASPGLPLLPPGLFLFFVYRRWWRRALERRIERDLAILQEGAAPDSAAASRRLFARRATGAAVFAGMALAASVLLNGVLLFLAWRLLRD